jgi:hypothetical protein
MTFGHSDEDLIGLLRRACWDPAAYATFSAAVRPMLRATLCYFDADVLRVNPAVQEALDTLREEIAAGWDDRRNYLLRLIALAQAALGRRTRAQALADAVARFGISAPGLFALLHGMAEAGNTRCSWIWRAHLLTEEQDARTLEFCARAVQSWLQRV